MSRRRRRRRRTSGYVYVFKKNRKFRRDHYKIGMTTSKNVKGRLSHARTGSSHPVEEYLEYKVRNARQAEIFLHKKFENKRIQKNSKNEWFRLNELDLARIGFLLRGK